MTQQQQEQDVFGQCVESALTWIQAVHERLRAIDNTEGPRAALETRLRETEVIRESEHEGWVKVDMALVAAETLLQSRDEEIKSQTHTRLKELKELWEETSTYITHCHSRIEWVWLHWLEYLRAQEEFRAWLARMQRALGPSPELQLGAREKVWHLEHHRVLLGKAHAQGPLLKRLLEEATDLHDRTQDPSVGPESRESLQDAYTQIRDRAEERVLLLQKIAEEHCVFGASTLQFWAWIVSVLETMTRYCDIEDSPENTLRPLQPEDTPENTLRPMQAEDTPENTLCALQALCETVDREETTLHHLEGAAKSVIVNTSPQGAEEVAQEVDRLRQAWAGLRQRLHLEEERKHAAQHSQEAYASRCERLRADASSLRLRVRQLDQELGPEGEERVEEEDEILWRKYMSVRGALAAEEAQVEQLKAQLTELFRLSRNPAPFSDQVLTAVKEFQGVKGRAFRLWTEREIALRPVLLDPLRRFSKWSLLVAQTLEASEEVADSSHFNLLVQNMEKLLKDSQQLQEHLGQLQVKGDLLAGMFGPERAESLGAELRVAMREREKQHGQLLQRKSHLQGLLSRTKDFGDTYESILKRLSLIRETFITIDKLQPDIPAKKTLSDQLMVILKDLEECDGHLASLQTLVPPRPADLHNLGCLQAEWKELRTAVKARIQESERSATDHQNFQEELRGLEKRLVEMRLSLESLCSARGDRGAYPWQAEAESALGGLPERELELRSLEAEGQRVLASTSEEGKGQILQDLEHLRESWNHLHMLNLDFHRLLIGDGVAGSDSCMTGSEGEGVTEGQIGSEMEGWPVGGEEDVFRKSGSEHDSGDYSEGEGDCVGQDSSVGLRIDAGVEGMGLGQDLRAERGLGVRDEGIILRQVLRVEGGLGFEDEWEFSDADGDISWGQGNRPEEGFDSGGKGMDLRQAVEADGHLGIGFEGMGLEQVSRDKERLENRAEGGFGVGDEGMDLGQDVRAERSLRAVDEGGSSTGFGGMGWGQEIDAEARFGVAGEGMVFEQGIRAEGRVSVGEEGIGLEQIARGKGGLGVGDGGEIQTGEIGMHLRVEEEFEIGAEWGFSAAGEGIAFGQGIRAEGWGRARVGEGVGAGPVGARVGQGVRAEGVLEAGDQGAHIEQGASDGWRVVGVLGAGDEEGFGSGQNNGIEQGLSARDQDMVLGWGIRTEGGLSAGGHNDIELDQGKKPGWGLSLSQNPPELCREQLLRGQEASGSQAKAEIEEVDLGGGYSQSPTKDHREGTRQKSGGGISITYRELSGEERWEVTGDASLAQESSGTSVDQLGQHTQVGEMNTLIQADGVNLQEEFEAWLQAENAKLGRILSQKGALSARVLRLKQMELEELRSHVGWGQSRLQEVLTSRGGLGPEDPGLEELRYRWVLYKSKLQDVGDLRAHLECKDVTVQQKETLRNVKKRSGLLQRACCVALPLQLFLLSLLLLAFFLPLTEEGASCSLANNFARSFRLMLRYKGPPPT